MGDTILIFHPDLRYAIKAKRMPEFVKPEKGTMISNPQLPVLPFSLKSPCCQLPAWIHGEERQRRIRYFLQRGEMSNEASLAL